MKITEMVISAILKKGILYEARNCDMEFEIPITQETTIEGVSKEEKIKIRFKAEHMSIKIDKE